MAGKGRLKVQCFLNDSYIPIENSVIQLDHPLEHKNK